MKTKTKNEPSTLISASKCGTKAQIVTHEGVTRHVVLACGRTFGRAQWLDKEDRSYTTR